MSAFDDLTLGEMDDIQAQCLDGKPISEADPLKLAAGIMWLTERKNGQPQLSWDDFKYSVKMGAIKHFSETQMAGDSESPTVAPAVS